MRLKRGKAEYKLPRGFDEFRQAWIQYRGMMMLLSQMREKEYWEVRADKKKNEILALPTSICVSNNKLYFWPTPDKAYTFSAYYTEIKKL